MSRPRFMLHGIGGVYNYGCEAIVRGTLRVLRERWPEARVSYASRSAAEDAVALADLDLEIMDIDGPSVTLRKVVRGLLRRAGLPNGFVAPEAPNIAAGQDALLSIGGDIFTLPAPPIPARPNLPQADFARAAQRRAPWVLWCASVGPFEDSPNALRRFREALNGASLILVREQSSENYLNGLGLGERVERVADPAFVMEPDSRDEDWPFDEAGGPVLGVNLSPLSLRHLALDPGASALATQVETLHRLRNELGLRLLLIPHVIDPRNPVDDDHRHLAAIAEALSERDPAGVRLLPPDLGARRSKAVAARCDALVAARMHCAIAGASSGVPTLFLAYSSKAVGMAECVYGDSERLMGVTEFTGDAGVSAVRKLMADGPGLRDRLTERLPELRRQAMGAADRLAERLSMPREDGADPQAGTGDRFSVAADDILEQITTQTRDAFALALGAAAGNAAGLDHAIGQTAEGQGLQEHLARPLQQGEEQAFAAEERVLEAADELDVVVHALLESHQATRINAQALAALQGAFDHRAAGVDEGQAVALQTLQDETLAAEEAGAQALVEGHGDVDAVGAAEVGVLLAEVDALCAQIHRDDLARVGRGKGGVPLLTSLVLEGGDEEALAHEGALDPLPDAALGAGVHADAVLQVEHGAGFGVDGFFGVEGDDDGLHVVAFYLVVDFVGHGWAP